MVFSRLLQSMQPLWANFRPYPFSLWMSIKLRYQRHKMCVLVLEEDAPQRAQVVKAIRQYGFRVLPAGSADCVQKLVKQHHFEAVIYGFSESNQDIIEFALRFNDEQSMGVHQLVMVPTPRSAFLNRETRKIRYYGGRFDKPVAGDEIAATVCKALDFKRMARAATASYEV